MNAYHVVKRIPAPQRTPRSRVARHVTPTFLPSPTLHKLTQDRRCRRVYIVLLLLSIYRKWVVQLRETWGESHGPPLRHVLYPHSLKRDSSRSRVKL